MKKYILLIISILFFLSAFSQDIILKKNGDEIKSKVLEVLPDMVKYKKFTSPDGPTYSVYISDIFMIKYEDGSKDVFNEEENTNTIIVPVNQTQTKKESSSEEKKSSFIDSRDSKEYKTIKIGDHWWMTENLNYESNQSWCYDDNPGYCEQYGRLYTFEAANNVCPDGWHLPSDEEWKELEVALGMKIGVDDEGWRGTNPGQGFKMKKGGGSGLDIELAGKRYWGAYSNLNDEGYYWTSSENLENPKKAFTRELGERASIKRTIANKDDAYNVRCIKGDSKNELTEIAADPKIDNYLAKKGNQYFSVGGGIGASYGGYGLKLQAKTGNRNIGIGFSAGLGYLLIPSKDEVGPFLSIGPRIYFYKSLYFSPMVSINLDGVYTDYIPAIIGCEIELHRHFNIDLGIGWIFSGLEEKATFNLGLNYKF